MFKVLLLELVKLYAKNLIGTPKENKRYSGYFIGFFVIVALILLVIADYIYIYNSIEYIAYVGVLLKISTSLFLMAGIIKLCALWLHWKKKQSELSSDITDFPSVTNDILPVVISMIPIGVVAYIIWVKVQVRFSGKTGKLRASLLRML